MDSMQYSKGNNCNKRQRILATGPSKVTDLPTSLISNCISFLDPENEPGHYIFGASVNKDFKAAAEELYQGVRNTSLESILSSPSICLYVLNLLREDPTDDIAVQTRKKILNPIFESDRVDLYLNALVKVYTLDGFHNNLAFLVRAVQYKSTEIMRSHINGNDDIIHFLTKFKLPAELNLPEGVEIKVSIDEVKNFVQSIPAACDPQMIQELVAKGVVFNYMSVLHSLKRNDIETFRCLLDIVRVQKDEDEIQSIIIETLNHHDLRLEAAKCLSERNYFAEGECFLIAMYIVITENSDNVIDLVKVFCESELNLSQQEYNTIVYACISSENMAILGYLHKSFRRINLELFRRLAVEGDLPDHVADYLQRLE
ncbi:predicted protein [Chaetoceros tenuissimus]|uniref:Uncharacterized protein n=1 Tax=Chaetoceros tenuissimus TaxID=426638 RepID=A0AAD3D3T0_9STRA|nr:predicted protein [Chaetoceros tenuissimus]